MPWLQALASVSNIKTPAKSRRPGPQAMDVRLSLLRSPPGLGMSLINRSQVSGGWPLSQQGGGRILDPEFTRTAIHPALRQPPTWVSELPGITIQTLCAGCTRLHLLRSTRRAFLQQVRHWSCGRRTTCLVFQLSIGRLGILSGGGREGGLFSAVFYGPPHDTKVLLRRWNVVLE